MAISYVGGTTLNFNGSANTFTNVSLTGLTGGSGSAPIEGDLVLVSYVAATTGGYPSLAIQTASSVDFTNVEAALLSDDIYDANLMVAWRVMGSTPDTVVKLSPTGNITFGGVCAIQVFRGTNRTTPIFSSASATGINTGRPTPASLNATASVGSWIVVCGGAANSLMSDFISSSFTTFIKRTIATTNDASVGMGTITSGSIYTSSAWTGGTADSAASWASMTLAIAKEPTAHIASVTEVAQASEYNYQGKPLIYVGGASFAEGTSLTSPVTYTIANMLTGGVAISASEGDLVIVAFSQMSNNVGQLTGTVTTAGFSTLLNIKSDAYSASNLCISYKVMGAVPDTAVSFNRFTISSYANAVIVQVWRNAHSSIFAGTAQTYTGTSAREVDMLVDSPAITPTHPGTLVMSFACHGANNANTDVVSPTGYSNKTLGSAKGGNGAIVLMAASKNYLPASSENPSRWTGLAGDSTDAFCTATLVIRSAGAVDYFTSASQATATVTASQDRLFEVARSIDAVTTSNDSSTGALKHSSESIEEGILGSSDTNGFNKLGDEIGFRGYGGVAGVNGANTVSFTALADDLVILAYYSYSSGGYPSITIDTTGYTSIALYAGGYSSCMGVYYKVMGAIPDTSAAFTKTGGGYTACIAYVIRGASTTNPIIVASAFTHGSANSVPDSAGVTMGILGSKVLSIGALYPANGIQAAPLTNINAPQASIQANGNLRLGIAAYSVDTDTSFDPPTWAGNAGDYGASSAVTVAIRPAGFVEKATPVDTPNFAEHAYAVAVSDPPAISYVGSASVYNSVNFSPNNLSTTLALPSYQVNDLVILATSRGRLQAGQLPAEGGYTTVGNYSGPGISIYQKVMTSLTDTAVTFNHGDISVQWYPFVVVVYVFRGASKVSQFASFVDYHDAGPDSPAVTITKPGSIVLTMFGSAYHENTYTGPTGYSNALGCGNTSYAYSSWICAATKQVSTVGVEDPGPWPPGYGIGTSLIMVGVTMVLEPINTALKETTEYQVSYGGDSTAPLTATAVHPAGYAAKADSTAVVTLVEAPTSTANLKAAVDSPNPSTQVSTGQTATTAVISSPTTNVEAQSTLLQATGAKTEPVTLTELPTGSLNTLGSVTNPVTPTDVLGGYPIYPVSLLESSTSTAVHTATSAYLAALSEGITLTEVVDSLLAVVRFSIEAAAASESNDRTFTPGFSVMIETAAATDSEVSTRNQYSGTTETTAVDAAHGASASFVAITNESITPNALATVLGSFVTAVVELVSLADAPSAIAAFVSTLQELGVSTATINSGWDAYAASTEAIGSYDASSGIFSFLASSGEALTANTAQTNLATFLASTMETGTNVEVLTAIAVLLASKTEASVAGDVNTGGAGIIDTISETVGALEGSARTLNNATLITETLAPTATAAAVVAFLASLTEAVSLIDTKISVVNFLSSLVEAVVSVPSDTASLATLVNITQPATLAAGITATSAWLANRAEASLSTDVQLATASFVTALVENAVGVTTETINAAVFALKSESLAALDSSTAVNGTYVTSLSSLIALDDISASAQYESQQAELIDLADSLVTLLSTTASVDELLIAVDTLVGKIIILSAYSVEVPVVAVLARVLASLKSVYVLASANSVMVPAMTKSVQVPVTPRSVSVPPEKADTNVPTSTTGTSI